MLLKFMALLTSLVPMVSAQTRVAQGESADAQSVIVTSRTRAFLSCESGDIVVKVNFTHPFRGLMYAHRSRSSPCRVHGIGGFYYTLRIPLKGCGTWQESPRVFVNNITIRFHPALELEEDETKTVVCRYPPPLTPSPGSVIVMEPPTSGPNVTPNRVGTARLSEVEILIIICLLLFLSLLTLGIGIAYFCLKRRNIHIVRKSTTASSAPPSQITRLSSSNIQPSSLLSSVLGHTVRIPRAVPYSVPAGRASMVSSPDHHYEEYPASTSTASGESSETSVSSSSEDQVDSSRNFLLKKAGVRTLLSIPKAILRKPALKKGPTIHNYLSKTSTASVGTSARSPETEDQTIITVLEPEVTDNKISSNIKEVSSASKKIMNGEANQKLSQQKKSAPIYAQVEKNKKAANKTQILNIENLNVLGPGTKPGPRTLVHSPTLLGAAKRQRSVITDIPEESVTSEEITKDTMVTTSVRREVTETRILSPTLSHIDMADGLPESSIEADSLVSQKDDTSIQSAEPNVVAHQPTRNILIRDVADIYLTTTVETESRELKTRMTRDLIEKHPKTEITSSTRDMTTDIVPDSESKTAKRTSEQAVKASGMEVTPSRDSWSVVIRQRKSPTNVPSAPTDKDSSESKSNNSIKDSVQSPPKERPVFNVMIRTRPADDIKLQEPDEILSIPPLEMPQAVSKLKEVLMPKTTEHLPDPKFPELATMPQVNSENIPDSKGKTTVPLRTVRWDDTNKDKSSTSSSDSYRSAESLRERSSSEVLEVAPTLPSQQRKLSHSMLERSTSEIVTSPEEHVRWVGGVVPVLETLSPEFLASIPVIQGGFFNTQSTSSPENKKKG